MNIVVTILIVSSIGFLRVFSRSFLTRTPRDVQNDTSIVLFSIGIFSYFSISLSTSIERYCS